MDKSNDDETFGYFKATISAELDIFFKEFQICAHDAYKRAYFTAINFGLTLDKAKIY